VESKHERKTATKGKRGGLISGMAGRGSNGEKTIKSTRLRILRRQVKRTIVGQREKNRKGAMTAGYPAERRP